MQTSRQTPSDEELVRCARTGDMTAFALLTERHRAGLRATAIAVLGYTDEADDAVQDALLTALRRLADLRDPAAVGPWLKALVRNNCRALLRARRPLPVGEPEPLLPPDPDPLPEELLEQAATVDWVRHALSALSPPIREVMLLRYFSGVSSYRRIAEVCGILPETVGSRLREGRRDLARRLRESADAAHDQVAAETGAWRRESAQLMTAMSEGGFGRVVDDWYHPHASLLVMGILHGDRNLMLGMLDWTLGAGVGVRLHDAAVSRDVLLWEADFLNPPSDPEHCPPTMACLFRLDQGRVAHMGIAYGGHRG
ncbi:sigma-70 family RNA polymerase sigma factor [Kineosporia sp. J2-2]|uniref:Sigma-70 family RNA polymerase sigma factor n=1 Tax=Kineosporia corallincola TaxID=2835133 RepID=A0ABS5TQ27_9ACTN|nr:sigma-70 family RNA polymerase sigma factor [Kineosporia corallincola]MBT0772286.1 sigma-70 family RNA polymerase sigma factor [Kineosporia corallincola]